MAVRKALPSDAARLAESNLAFNEVDTAEVSIERKLKDGSSPEIVLVAESAGEVVGFATAQTQSSICYDETWAELVELFVDEGSRRKGCGRALVEGIERAIRDQGGSSLFLRTNRTNNDAQALYHSMGFEKQTNVVFEKRL